MRILYFAAVREALGRTEDTLDPATLGAAPTVADLWSWLIAQHPPAARWRAFVRVAVNHTFADDDTPLHDADEVAIIPPVSGGSDTPEPPTESHTRRDGRVMLTLAPLDVVRAEALITHHGAGGVVSFTGRVRDHTDDHEVDHLVYEAYPPMVLATLEQVCDEIEARWPTVRIAIHHRWGTLTLGEAAVVVSTSSPHRAEAFAANQHAIDRLKQIVPIWKKEVSPTNQTWLGFGP